MEQNISLDNANQEKENENQQYDELVKDEQTNNNSLYMTIRIVFNYIVSDIQRKPRSFKIGLFTIYLVVTFISLLKSSFQMSPLIFLQLSETQASDTDLLISPVAKQIDIPQNFGPEKSKGNNTNIDSLSPDYQIFKSINLINSSQVENATEQINSIFGVSSRWFFIGNIHNPNNNNIQINRRMRSYILIIDSQRELSIGLGRRLQVNPLKNNEAYLTRSTMRGLNLTEGDDFILNIDLLNFLNSQDGKQQEKLAQLTDEMIQEMIDSQLKQLFGIDVLNISFNSSEIKTQIDNLIDYIDIVNDKQIKEYLKSFIMNLLDQAEINQKIKENLIKLIDQTLEQNITDLFNQLKQTIDSLPDNFTFTIGDISFNLGPIILQSLNFNTTFKINEKVNSSKGKWADGLGNVMVIDYKNISKIFITSFKDQLKKIVDNASLSNDTVTSNQAKIASILLFNPFINLFDDLYDFFNLSDYSLTSNLVLNDRENIYTDQDSIRRKMISVSNDFYQTIGKNHSSEPQTPLALAMTGFLIIKNFLDNMVFSATFLLLMLSTLLIYSLMIGDVEEKTYEFGMLRALGFDKKWLIALLLLEALVFAIPGLILGLLSSYLLNSIIGMIIFSSTQLYSSYQLTTDAIILGVTLGIIMPLISNVLPIFRALSKTLRDSLDLYHRVLNEAYVQVIRLERMGLSLEQTLIALLLVIMGFVSYYLAPLAFVFQKIQLFLQITNIILIIMILGFTLLINQFQGILERGILKLILCFNRTDQNLQQIIKKNMQGHGSRNNKTTLMYTIALSFLIFAGAGFALQSKVIEDFMKLTLGSEVTVFVPPTDQIGLDEYKIRQYMALVMKNDPSLIRQFSFATFGMNQFPSMPRRIGIMPLSYFPRRNTIPVGVERELMESLLLDYYVPNDYDKSLEFPELHDGKKDGVYGLYYRNDSLDLPLDSDIKGIKSNHKARTAYYKDLNKPNKQKEGIDREINIILPEGLRYEVSMSVDTPAIISLQWIKTFRLKVRHMATKIPGFRFSGYRQIAFQGESLVSMPDFQYMLNQYYNGNIETGEFPDPQVKQFFELLPKNLTYGLPKDSMFITFKRATTKEERIDFTNGLRNYFRDENTLLFDVNTLVEDASSTFFYLQLFYIIVGLVTMILSFFLILVSFVSNIRENSWELGVLRAVGLNKGQITRIFIYEAICLIFASGLLGTLIGIVVAVTLTLQMLMFIELPFVFTFPTFMFLVTFIGGFFTALFGSYFAIRGIRNKSISSILKGLQ